MNNPSICYRCAKQEKCSMHKNDTSSTVVSNCGRFTPDEETKAFMDEFIKLQRGYQNQQSRRKKA